LIIIDRSHIVIIINFLFFFKLRLFLISLILEKPYRLFKFSTTLDVEYFQMLPANRAFVVLHDGHADAEFVEAVLALGDDGVLHNKLGNRADQVVVTGWILPLDELGGEVLLEDDHKVNFVYFVQRQISTYKC
jgi:hypothetical protein